MTARGARSAACLAVACAAGCALAACAQLIGTDFSGNGRGPGASDDATNDGTLPGSDGAGNDGILDPSEGAASDGSAGDVTEPRFAFCTFAASASECSCQTYATEYDAGQQCDETTYPSAFCCADPDYPLGGQCTCAAWRCVIGASGGCYCGAYREGGAGGTCQGTFCCAHPSVYTCGCGDAAVFCKGFTDANEIPVSECSRANQPCPNGGRRVTSCTRF